MSDPNQPPKPAGGPGDPAMDDILASIRRILNEDEDRPAQPGAAPAPAAPPIATSAEPEPLDLTEAMMVQPAPVPAAAPPVAVAPAPEPVMPVATPEPSPAAAPAPAADTLVAPAVAAATSAALGQLLRTVAQERTTAVHKGGPTIEDVVREELRPMLKAWLDQHLPPLVERLVRAEIERVVNRSL